MLGGSHINPIPEVLCWGKLQTAMALQQLADKTQGGFQIYVGPKLPCLHVLKSASSPLETGHRYTGYSYAKSVLSGAVAVPCRRQGFRCSM